MNFNEVISNKEVDMDDWMSSAGVETVADIRALFDRAGHETSERGPSVYLCEFGLFPIFVRPFGGDAILYWTYLEARPEFDDLALMDKAQELNRRVPGLSVEVRSERMYFNLIIPSSPCVSRSAVVDTALYFSRLMEAILQKFDGYSFLYPVGKSRSSEPPSQEEAGGN
jgi:hypothetical protein